MLALPMSSAASIARRLLLAVLVAVVGATAVGCDLVPGDSITGRKGGTLTVLAADRPAPSSSA